MVPRVDEGTTGTAGVMATMRSHASVRDVVAYVTIGQKDSPVLGLGLKYGVAVANFTDPCSNPVVHPDEIGESTGAHLMSARPRRPPVARP